MNGTARSRLAWLAPVLLAAAAGPARGAGPEWVEPMRKVRAKFTGTPGTLALFGDSITVSMAFWAPLESAPKALDPEAAKALGTVRGTSSPSAGGRGAARSTGTRGG